MKKLLLLGFALALATFPLPSAARAEDNDDKATDAATEEASEAAKKMGMEMPDAKKMMEDDEKEEAKERAAAQAVVDAPGPAVLPGWVPQTPQFTPAGPVAKKRVDEEALTELSGTSPLTPEQLGDAWEKAIAGQKLNHNRNNTDVNGTKTVILFLQSQTDPPVEVRLEAKRAPEEKITHVSISSPLAVPEVDDDGED